MRTLVIVIVGVLLVVGAAGADLAPDEYGAAVIVGQNPGAVPAVTAMSWEVARIAPASVFATILAPERGGVGIGVDAGRTDSRLRGGIGYVDDDLWGVYLRVGW